MRKTSCSESNGAVAIEGFEKKVRPIGDQILVRQVEAETVSPGGIVLPDMVAENARPLEGVVLAVGRGARSPLSGERIEMDVHPGDRVVFARHAGSDTKVEGEELMLISERDVLAVLL